MSETEFAREERLSLLYFLKEEVKKLEDKIAKLEKVADVASEVLASDGFHYLGELRDALKELGGK